jgi:hypothetical protein
MRTLAMILMFAASPAAFGQSAPQDSSPEAIARHACTGEGMWCQDAKHSRCCRGLKCVNSECKKADHEEQGSKKHSKS